MGKSTKRGARGKRKSDFPLWKHTASGRWCRKVKGRFLYFGRIDDDPSGEQALQKWVRVKDHLLAGREPPANGGGLTIAELANHWLTYKHQLLEAGELAQRTFDGYHSAAGYLVSSLGKGTQVESLGPADFQALRGRMANGWGPVRVKNTMGIVESIFRYGDQAGLFDVRIRFGPGWKKPTAKTLRKNRARKGPRLFTPEQIQAALEHAGPNMRGMILLGIQAGLGNTDVGLLPVKALDLAGGWLHYPRPKTGIDRRVPLWAETVAALRELQATRREPKDPADDSLVFVGVRGQNYIGKHRGNRVSQEFARVVNRAGIEGRSFYDLRRTFQTIGEESGDLVAVGAIMGHAAGSGDMAAIYRQRVSDARLRAVTGHIRAWLFGREEVADE